MLLKKNMQFLLLFYHFYKEMLINIVYTHILLLLTQNIIKYLRTLIHYVQALASLCVVGGLVTCTVTAFCGQFQIVQKL